MLAVNLSRLSLVAALFLALAAGPRPAAAEVPAFQVPPPGSEAEALARAAIEQLIRALGLALQAVPQYEMPRLNERGDIVIRRVNPPDRKPVTRVPGPDEADT
jgi:hypothetical protein